MIGSDVPADTAEALLRCQMPDVEINWVLTANDPAVVHMILELHRERLEEELAERRRALGDLEAGLAKRAGTGVSANVDPSWRSYQAPIAGLDLPSLTQRGSASTDLPDTPAPPMPSFRSA